MINYIYYTSFSLNNGHNSLNYYKWYIHFLLKNCSTPLLMGSGIYVNVMYIFDNLLKLYINCVFIISILLCIDLTILYVISWLNLLLLTNMLQKLYVIKLGLYILYNLFPTFL